jgi:autotransporter-associated beta strand protein
LNGVPGATGATANFLGVITAPRTVTLDSNRTVGVLQFNNANAYTIAGTSTLTFDQSSGAADLSVVLGDHVISSAVALNDTLAVSFGTAAESVAIDGAISGAGGITKTGGGDITLGGSNTFLGNVAFDTGTLSFANGGLGEGDLAIGNASLIWLPGNTQDITDRAVTFGAGPITFDIGAGDVTLANAFGGGSGAAFNKLGAGKLTLAADADFTGPVSISGGALQLGSGGAAGAVVGAITNNGGLIVSRSADLALSQVISGTGFLTHQGASVLTLAAANTFTGETSITNASGSLLLGNTLALQGSTLLYGSTGGSLSFGALTAVTLGGLSGNKDLELANTTPAGVALTVGGNNSTTTYAGVLSGAGSLTKAGTGTLSLTGISSYAGGTTLTGGILEIAAGGSLATSFAQINTGMLSVNGGSLACTATSTINTGGPAGGIHILNSGAATFATVQSGTADNGLLALEDGTLNAENVILQRTASLGTGENPTAVPDGSGFVVTGGTANITGVLTIGTSNSSATGLINGGVTTVAGVVTVGNTSNTRWSALEVRDGVFTSTDITSGVVLSPNAGTANNSAFIVSTSGTATVEKVTFGAAGSAAGIGRVAVTGGTLYVGSGGMVQAAPSFTPQINLGGGTLAAKDSWSTNLPINVTNLTTSVISAANANGDPFSITLNGSLTGNGNLDKSGAGTLTLAGGHSYAGNTTVLKGVLRVQTKTFDDAATVGVELAAGATLDLAFSGGDLVAGFKVDGTLLGDGIYGSMTNPTLGIIKTAAITGPGLLYVNVAVPPSGFDNWASSNGLTAGNNGPNDDPDNDGIDNLLEFVLGGLPLVSSTDVLPDLVVNATNFVFTFNRNDDSEAEVALVFQYGSNLTGWTDVTIGAASAPADINGVIVDVIEGTPATDPDAITVTVPRTQGVSGKLFGRVKAQK